MLEIAALVTRCYSVCISFAYITSDCVLDIVRNFLGKSINIQNIFVLSFKSIKMRQQNMKTI